MRKEQYVDGLVSVITPVYNAERFLEETLQSVFAQTYTKLELILVDDCSTDRSAEVIQSHCPEHPELVYYRQKTNSISKLPTTSPFRLRAQISLRNSSSERMQREILCITPSPRLRCLQIS